MVDEAGPEARTGLLVGRARAQGFWGSCLPTGVWSWFLVSLATGPWGPMSSACALVCGAGSWAL